MEYLAFALKYRPQDFSEVVGQEHVVSVLRNAILKERVHHAYLFSGPRGVGKTSLARIFAKALNCEKGPTINPCGECTSCVEITKGTSLDVIEIDGASNRGIDDIRALRESVNLLPAHSRYKIYIIDEVHQITPDAFNALLKTLEEPPPHVKFIFATTHPQKVLPTILSRCQKFQFHLLPVEKIIQKLDTIIKKEKLDIDKGTLNSIAHAAGGSIRDAESLLDQIVPIVLEKGEVKDLMSFLGIIDEATLGTIADHIIRKDIQASLDFIQKFTEEGKDLGILLNSLIEYFRDIILCKVSPKTFKELKDISPSSKEDITKESGAIAVADILRAIDLFIYAKDLSRKLNSMRIPIELAVIKFSSSYIPGGKTGSNNYGVKNIEKIVSTPVKPKVDDTKDSRGNARVRMPHEGNLSHNVTKNVVDDNKIKTKDAGAQSAVIHGDTSFDDIGDIDFEQERRKVHENVGVSSPAEGKHNPVPLTLQDVLEKWPRIITEISKTRVSLASYLSGGTPYSLDKGVLRLSFTRKCSFNKEIVEEVKNIKYIERYLDKYLGYNIGIKCFLKTTEDVNTEENRGNSESHDDEENDFINEIIDTFGGDIHTNNE